MHKQIEEAYGEKVRFVFKHFPLDFHKDAPLAHQASIAAGEQGQFWEMYEKIFENQKAIKREDLEKYAAELGLDVERFRAALDEGIYQSRIDEDLAAGKKVQVRGTPTTFVNGRLLKKDRRFDDFEIFKLYIEEELKKTDKMIKDGVKPGELYAKLIENGKEFVPPPPLEAKINRFSVEGAPSKGPEDAKITIVEFSDFQCPFCGRIAAPLNELTAKYPEQVRVVFKQFPLSFHKDAQKAAEGALIAHAAGKFWEMHDLLFQNTKEVGIDKLMYYAGQLGFDPDSFKADLDSNKYAAQVKADMAEGQRAGVRGTPSLFVNGRKCNECRALPDMEKLFAKEFGLAVKE